MSGGVLLEVAGLTVSYSRGFRRPPMIAVSDVSFKVGRGETVSIVGESGSGKTTIGSAILGLQPVSNGSILLNGADIAYLSRRERRSLRATLQAVFQDPFSSLDPTKTIGDAVGEPLRVAEPRLKAGTVRQRAAEALERVGLDPERRPSLSGRILRRATPTHRNRKGANPEAGDRCVRRGGERSRCFGAGAGA